MSKNKLISGFIYVLIGVGFMIAAYLTETAAEGILWGLGAIFFFTGIVVMIQYAWRNSPKRRAKYVTREETAKAELKAGSMPTVKDKAGRYAYVLGLYVAVISIVIFAVLDAFGVVESARTVVIYLGGYVIFQLIAGNVIYKRLTKKK